MRIDHLHLTNFRCYEDMEFSFSPHFNLIVGENGAGKTALLNALAVAMGSWFLGIRGYDSRNIQDNDIRRIVKVIDQRHHVSPQFPVVVSAIGSIDGISIPWKRTLDGPSGRTTQREATKIKVIAEKYSAKEMNGENVVFPVISFYGAGRLWTEPRDTRNVLEKYRIRNVAPQDFASIKEDVSDVEYFAYRKSGYRYSVDDRCSPRDLLRWMRHERRLEVDEEEKSEPFRMVLSAIESSLFENEKVDYSLKHDSLMLTNKSGETIPFKYLSDGYKNVISLVEVIRHRLKP